MSNFINHVWYVIDSGWSTWCGLLRHQSDWWDPYGASAGALLVFVFLGLAVKFVRE